MTGTVVTVNDLLPKLADWLAEDVADGAPSPETLRAYRSDLAQHGAWLANEGIEPEACDRETLKRYRTWLLGQGYKTSTVNRKLASVRRLYALAEAHGVRAGNPAAGLKGPADRAQSRVKFLTPEQIRAVLALPDVREPKGVRDRAMLVLLYAHTLRIAEVCGLTLADVDLHGGETGLLRILGKGRKERPVYLTERTQAELRAWLTVRRSVGAQDAHVFVSLHHGDGSHGPGYGLDVRGARYMVDGYLTVAGLKQAGRSCHLFRHSGATHALTNGAPLEALQDQLGHSDPRTTRVYAKVVMDLRHNPAKYVDEVLGCELFR